jgi:ABC-type uncharacterized transport system involved in gliding motility auxiliary subunit
MGALRRRLVVTVAGVLLERNRRQLDLTSERSLTLSSETKAVVHRVHGHVRITAALSDDDPERTPAGALLSRYHRLDPSITYRVVDPSCAPGSLTRLGIDPALGGLAVQRGSQIEQTSTVSEQDITGALARIVRGRSATVCATTGQGERTVHDTVAAGLSELGDLLHTNGYTVEDLDLLKATSVPSSCRAVLVVAPTGELGAGAQVLATYLRDGGRALVMADPESNVDLTPILAPYGLAVERGIVFEGSDDARLAGDPVTPVVRDYRSLNPIVRRLAPTAFPAPEALALRPGDIGGLQVEALATTSPLSFLERNPNEPKFDAGVDIPGPIVLAAAADRSANAGSRIIRSRIVAFSDAAFATNAYLGRGGNSQLVVRALDWAALEGDLVAVSSNVAALRPLDFTASRARYAELLMAGIVPLLFLVAGSMVWAVRRGR